MELQTIHVVFWKRDMVFAFPTREQAELYIQNCMIPLNSNIDRADLNIKRVDNWKDYPK